MGVYHQGDGLHGPDGPHTLQVVAIGSLWGDATVGLALRHRLGTARDIAAWGPAGYVRGCRAMAKCKFRTRSWSET